jgi:hypothetical protein
MNTRLSLRSRAVPTLDTLDTVDRTRLGPHLRAWRSLADVEFFDVIDDFGAHLYDLCLYRGEDGTVYAPGSLDVVAGFSQGSACESDDENLLEALDLAFLRRPSHGSDG